jgi:hypothetical protein
MVTFDAIRRTHRYAGVADTQKVAFNPVGQVVGQITEQQSCRQVVYELVNEYLAAVERLNAIMPEA